jgi:HSP20 family protein
MAQAQGNGSRDQQGTQQPRGSSSGGESSTQLARRSQGQETTTPARRSRGLSSSSALSPFFSSSPFHLVRRVFDDMERMMESMFSDFDEALPETAGSLAFVPRIDVTRRGDQIVVHADLPGLSPEDIEIHASEDGLVIEGERRHDAERRQGDAWRSERSYGRFYRLIPLPEGAELDSAQARFENGVLEISVKAPEGRGGRRRIEIQTHTSPQGQALPQEQDPQSASQEGPHHGQNQQSADERQGSGGAEKRT